MLIQLPASVFRMAEEYGLSAWALIPLGDVDEIPGSWLWPGTAPVIVVIGEWTNGWAVFLTHTNSTFQINK